MRNDNDPVVKQMMVADKLFSSVYDKSYLAHQEIIKQQRLMSVLARDMRRQSVINEEMILSFINMCNSISQAVNNLNNHISKHTGNRGNSLPPIIVRVRTENGWKRDPALEARQQAILRQKNNARRSVKFSGSTRSVAAKLRLPGLETLWDSPAMLRIRGNGAIIKKTFEHYNQIVLSLIEAEKDANKQADIISRLLSKIDYEKLPDGDRLREKMEESIAAVEDEMEELKGRLLSLRDWWEGIRESAEQMAEDPRAWTEDWMRGRSDVEIEAALDFDIARAQNEARQGKR